MTLGTASLVKNTVAGIIGVVDKITGSVGKGISAICYDEEYF